MINLKQEFKEYRQIYNTFSDSFKEDIENYEELRKKVISRDKEDLKIQNESKEKLEMLNEILFIQYKISLKQGDLSKVGERLLYLNEVAMRTGEDLELTDEDKNFISSLSANSSSSYVIENGNVVSKVSNLEDIIKKQIAEQKDSGHLFLDRLRKSKEYQDV